MGAVGVPGWIGLKPDKYSTQRSRASNRSKMRSAADRSTEPPRSSCTR